MFFRCIEEHRNDPHWLEIRGNEGMIVGTVQMCTCTALAGIKRVRTASPDGMNGLYRCNMSMFLGRGKLGFRQWKIRFTRTWVIGIINSLGRSNMLPNMLKGPACAMPMSLKVTFEPGQFPEFSLFPGPCSTAGPCHLGVTGGCRSTKRARILCANCHMKLSILTRGSTRRPFYRQTNQVIGRCPDMPTPRIGISW